MSSGPPNPTPSVSNARGTVVDVTGPTGGVVIAVLLSFGLRRSASRPWPRVIAGRHAGEQLVSQADTCHLKSDQRKGPQPPAGAAALRPIRSVAPPLIWRHQGTGSSSANVPLKDVFRFALGVQAP